MRKMRQLINYEDDHLCGHIDRESTNMVKAYEYFLAELFSNASVKKKSKCA